MHTITLLDKLLGRGSLIRDLNATIKDRDDLRSRVMSQARDILNLERERNVSRDEANLNKEQIKNLLQEISRLQSLVNGDSKADVGASSISPERINPNVLRSGRSSLASDRSGQIGGASASPAMAHDSTSEQMLLVAAAAAIASSPEPTYTPAPAPTPEPAYCAPTRSYESPSHSPSSSGDSGYSSGDSGGGGGGGCD